LVFVKRFDLEVVFELQYLFGLTLALRSFQKIVFEFLVKFLKILLLLFLGHEEEIGELRVAFPELLQHMWRKGMYVVEQIEVIILRILQISFLANILPIF
jgi:hypothetical protein